MEASGDGPQGAQGLPTTKLLLRAHLRGKRRGEYRGYRVGHRGYGVEYRGYREGYGDTE